MGRRLSDEERYQRSITEDDLQLKVCSAASWLGWHWWHDNDSRRNKAGLPDLMVWGYGQFFMVELKRETGRLSAVQEVRITELVAAGVEVHVWRPSDWPQVEARLRSRRPAMHSESVEFLRAGPQARRRARRTVPPD